MDRLFTPRRQLGRTGFAATALGIGDVADRNVPIETCIATVRRGIDAGLNIVDTAPGYEDGYSEEIVGRAVRESAQRDHLFVINKIDFLDQPVAPQVESSLKRMGMSAVDLFVFHALSDMSVWRKTAAPGSPGGGMEQLGACVKQGKARFRGISSHHPDVLREAILSGLCDVVMFPVGPFVDQRYVDVILALCKERGVGSVCFKTFGAGRLLGDTAGYNRPLQVRPRQKLGSGGTDSHAPLLPHLSVETCVHYTLTCDPDVALLGMSFPNEQDAAFAAAKSFKKPLGAAAMADIRTKAAAAMEGKGGGGWNPPVESVA